VHRRQRSNHGRILSIDALTRPHIKHDRTFAQRLAENIAESLSKGDRVFVHGTIATDTWTDNQTGDKRTAQRVLAEIVGPSLRWATTRITKTTRTHTNDDAPDDAREQEA
jgi:single-strand DNA-binding protein